jgi:hypothetical protein
MATITENQIRRLPRGSEMSILASPREPNSLLRGYRRENVRSSQIKSSDDSVNQLSKKVENMRRRILGGSSQPFTLWQTPNRELDPTVSVASGTFVYISPGNPLVTVGLTDLVSTTLLQAMPGIWQAVQDVPAEAAVDGVMSYNMPQVVPTGSVTGTPLKGDADNSGLFWIPWASIMNCG